jgi:hypothetical protein
MDQRCSIKADSEPGQRRLREIRLAVMKESGHRLHDDCPRWIGLISPAFLHDCVVTAGISSD